MSAIAWSLEPVDVKSGVERRFRFRFGSVRVRITVLASLALIIGLVVGGTLLYGSLRNGLIDAQSGTGPARAAELAALAGRAPLPAVLPALDASGPAFLQVVDPAGLVIAASERLIGAAPLRNSDQPSRVTRRAIDGLGNGPWLVETTPATFGGRSELLVVVTSLRDAVANAEVVRNRLAVTLTGLVAIVAALIWVVVGRALRTVDRMRADVTEISASHLDRRLPVPAGGDEIARLATTLNEMLDRLEIAGRAQRRFVADASHELRTPIANSRAALEVAGAHPESADWVSIAPNLLVQNGRMERLTNDLLMLARGQNGTDVRCAENIVVADLIERVTQRPVPTERRLIVKNVVATGPGPVMIHGDPEQLDRMLSNLIDNALRHARRTVIVEAVVGSTTVELRVSDDGPGVAVVDRENIFRPFVRLDDHRTRGSAGTGGTGLGLAIVEQIVEGHHGTIRVLDNQPGATFAVRLPISGSSQHAENRVGT